MDKVNIEDLKRKGYFIAYIDGEKCTNINLFLEQIGVVFRFPEYYGRNMNALGECINDLSWIQEKNYALVILNSDQFLENELQNVRNETWDLLEKYREEWASVPNYDGEDEYRQKADFVVVRT